MYKLRPKLVVKWYYKRYDGRGSAGSHHLGNCEKRLPSKKSKKLAALKTNLDDTA